MFPFTQTEATKIEMNFIDSSSLTHIDELTRLFTALNFQMTKFIID